MTVDRTGRERAASELSIAFVGGAQMATAVAVGLLRSGWNVKSILVVDPNQQHCARQTLGVRRSTKADAELAEANQVSFATVASSSVQGHGAAGRVEA